MEHCLKSNFQQVSHKMFCKNIAGLAVARKHHRAVTHSYASQQKLTEGLSYRTYSKRVVANFVLSNVPIINKTFSYQFYSKYHPFIFICLLKMISPYFQLKTTFTDTVAVLSQCILLNILVSLCLFKGIPVLVRCPHKMVKKEIDLSLLLYFLQLRIVCQQLMDQIIVVL